MSSPADSRLQSIRQNAEPLLLTEASVESTPNRWLSGVVIASVFLGVSLFSSAIPGINEPHYLCKARAFDDPAWCSRDFFLASANAHYCFFVVTGFLTRWLSFDAIAVLGRVISVVLLATGWTMLGRSLGLSAAWRILAACVFATISQLGNFSGEWLLGGFESKVPAWGLCLTAISLWIRGQLRCCPGWMTAAGIVCGLACSLHPVVGGWVAACLSLVSLAVVSADFSETVRSFFRRVRQARGASDGPALCSDIDAGPSRLSSRLSHPTEDDGPSVSHACTQRTVRGANNDYAAVRLLKPLIGIGMFAAATIVVSLPGLIPALRLVLDTSNPQPERELASFFQVFWRLKHHLDPTELLPSQWFYAAVLLGGIVIGAWWVRSVARPTDSGSGDTTKAWNCLLAVFTMSALIAAAGIVIGWHTEVARDMDGWQWRASLLKFYPFRAFDALLPIVAALALTRVLQSGLALSPGRLALHRIGVLIVACGMPLAVAWHSRELAPPGYTVDQYAEWQEACRWVRENTPESSLVLTPRESFAFKWMAERAEFVCYKDCPQDTAGILTWNKRLWLLHDWTLKSSSDGGYDAVDLKSLRVQTDCDYILTRILGPFDEELLWQGREWRIFAVPE